eukprot:CAMPEP_0171294416 /NCGR_PEP_ID=MMETSP0816-20121228/2897_1 /TAXON_ID=420281 /ORGANISM="Proboscia inermis, Strain CCAP1064/1" /LENGTH=125 /DNA_ID=CAMNT_0011766225 /DNA_START=60 /DNA_END=437 /DNA_ORIENTATION=+
MGLTANLTNSGKTKGYDEIAVAEPVLVGKINRYNDDESANHPPGVMAGGQWGVATYVGNKTMAATCLGCLVCPLAIFVLACPFDEIDAYKVDDKLYNAEGTEIKGAQFKPERHRTPAIHAVPILN